MHNVKIEILIKVNMENGQVNGSGQKNSIMCRNMENGQVNGSGQT